VKVNQMLARLDTSRLEAQVLQARASLESAKARVLQARATVREAGSNLARLRKVRELSGNRTPSQYEIDAAEAALERALADEANAHANVSQAKAALEVNETDLSKAVIHSPINGIVLQEAWSRARQWPHPFKPRSFLPWQRTLLEWSSMLTWTRRTWRRCARDRRRSSR